MKRIESVFLICLISALTVETLKDIPFHEYKDFITEDADPSARSLAARSLQSPRDNSYVNAYQRQLDTYQESLYHDYNRGGFGQKYASPEETQQNYDYQEEYNGYNEPYLEQNRKQDFYEPQNEQYEPSAHAPPRASYDQLSYQPQATHFPKLKPFETADFEHSIPTFDYEKLSPPYNEPELNPKSSYHPPEPAYQPHTNYYQPEPVYHQPEPVYHQPEPVYHQPELGYHQPEPEYHAPVASYGPPSPSYEPAPYKPPPVLKNPTYHGPEHEHEYEDDHGHHGVRGIPGKDYPIYGEIPPTSFSCDSVPVRPGMYADVEAHCQVYRVCEDGRHGYGGAAALCPNGTLFNQEHFECDYWYNVDCSLAPKLYDLNLDPYKNPFGEPHKLEPHKKPHHEPYPSHHGHSGFGPF